MSVEGWVLVSLLFLLLVGVTTQFGRLLLYLINMHREERHVNNEANRKVIHSLECAIRETGGVTNNFNADKQQNQIGNENDQT
jgi:hypothetical protein